MFCPHCGGEFTAPQMGRCPHCGNEVNAAGGSPGPAGGSGGPPPVPGTGGGSGKLPPPTGGGGGETPYAPFEDTSLGFFDGIVETVKGVLGAPQAFYRRMPDTADIGRPVLYYLVLAFVGNFFKAAWGLIVNALALPFQQDPEQIRQALEQAGWSEEWIDMLVSFTGGGGAVAQAIASVLIGPIIGLIGLFIAVGITHVLLMLYGGANRDFGASFRVFAYAASLQLLLLVPVCGGMISGIWTLVVVCIGLTAAHRTDGWRAVLAVLTPAILCCLCVVGTMFLIFGILSSNAP